MWRAARGIKLNNKSLTGLVPDDDRDAEYHRHLKCTMDARYSEAIGVWERKILDYTGKREDHTAALAKHLDSLARAGHNAERLLDLAAARKPRPVDHPTSALGYRIKELTTPKKRKHQSIDPFPPLAPARNRSGPRAVSLTVLEMFRLCGYNPSMRSIDALRVLAGVTAYQWGMVTTAQAAALGVSRLMLSRLTEAAHLERLAHGVYKDAGSPGDEFDDMRAAWLSTDPKRLAYDRCKSDADVVFAAASAARLHGIGELWDRHHDFITRTRRQSQRSEIRYRQRSLAADDVVTVQGLPALSLEATVADLFNADADLRHIANALRDAAHKGRLDFDRLQVLLAPYAAQAGLKKGDGAGMLEWLMELAGIDVASMTRFLAHSATYNGLAETAALVRNLDMSSRYDGGVSEIDPASRVPLSGPAGRRVLAHRGELRALLRRHGVTNPEIFGSAARGDDREDSDIDLLVDFAPGTSIIDIIGIQREIRDLLGVPVDLVPRNGLKERVRARAEKDLLPL